MYQDITLTEAAIKAAGRRAASTLSFRNHYVASISIQQRQARPEGLVWVAVLSDKKLMRDAHCEDDAQSTTTLETSDFTNFDVFVWRGRRRRRRPPPVGSLRFRLEQPSPTWRSLRTQTRKS